MSVNKKLTLSKYSRILAIIVSMTAGNTINIAEARQLDAGFILNEMEPKQQHSFVIGIVEGLAYSRFLKERPDETGMSCVQNWIYKDTAMRWKEINVFFRKHLTKPPTTLLHHMIKKECGE
jgi:hypothetical protein